MPNITLTCPTGTYISHMKNFGFAYKKDKRINAPSHGSSLCHAAMHPLDDPINADELEGKGGESPRAAGARILATVQD